MNHTSSVPQPGTGSVGALLVVLWLLILLAPGATLPEWSNVDKGWARSRVLERQELVAIAPAAVTAVQLDDETSRSRSQSMEGESLTRGR